MACFLTYRILLQEKRNCLLMQLEEATRLASYLQSQLKRWVTFFILILILRGGGAEGERGSQAGSAISPP